MNDFRKIVEKVSKVKGNKLSGSLEVEEMKRFMMRNYK